MAAAGTGIEIRGGDAVPSNRASGASTQPSEVFPPTVPGNLWSPTHHEGVQSCSTFVTVNWTASTDDDSGLAGYVGVWDTSPLTTPTVLANIGPNATSYSLDIGSSTVARYFHLRGKDYAGNLGPTWHFGPVLANANSVSTYCTGKTNSLGCVPTVSWSGTPDVSSGTFTVHCANVINNKNGLLYWGRAPAAAPFQGGFMCIASPTRRTQLQLSFGNSSGNSCTGSFDFTFTTSYMNQENIDPGNTIYCEFWMRDPAIASTTGLSNAIQFTVCE